MRMNYDILLGKFVMHKHSASSIVSPVAPAIGVTGNGLVGTVPAGHLLEKIVVIKRGTISNPAPPPATIPDITDVDLQFGTTVGGDEIFTLQTALAGSNNPWTMSYSPDEAMSAFNVYVSSPAWGTSVVDIYFYIIKIK